MKSTGTRKSSRLQLLEELIQTANRCGLTVRREKLLREVGYRVRSGECRLRDKNYVIIDRDQDPNQQLETLLEVLSRRSLDNIELSPTVARLLKRGSLS